MDQISSMEEKDDAEIIELVPADKEFFGVLIRRYERRIIFYIRRISGGTDEEIEDLAQNIFLKAYVYLNSFRPGENFSSWLYGIAHNECIDHWRKNKKHSGTISLEASANLLVILQSDEDISGEFQKKWTSEIVQKAISALPFKYREIIVLRFLEDKSYEEIAQILQKPVSTVGTLVRRAKELIKEIIQQ